VKYRAKSVATFGGCQGCTRTWSGIKLPNLTICTASMRKILQQLLRADLLSSAAWQSESFYSSTTEPSSLIDLTAVSMYRCRIYNSSHSVFSLSTEPTLNLQ